MNNLRERLLQISRGVPNYLTFEALETGTFTFTIPTHVNASRATSVSYSIDNGSTWTTTTIESSPSADVVITTPTIAAGDVVMWKGIAKGWNGLSNYTAASASRFSSTGTFNVYGELMSMLKGANFMTDKTLEGYYNFVGMFYQTKVVDASDLIFPDATDLPQRMYGGMFKECTELMYGPRQIMSENTTLIREREFIEMFYGCTSLISGPEHLYGATCYIGAFQDMFYNCINLTTAPTLHQTTLGGYGYYRMFRGCTSLTVAPTIIATTFSLNYGYHCAGMFNGCTSLTTANFTLYPTAIGDRSYMEMFRGCTNLVTGPTVNATSVTGVNSLYAMFLGDTKLEYSQEFVLSIGTLNNGCYSHLFYSCRKINNVKLLATDISASNCLQNWLYGVSSTGTLTATASLGLPTGVSGKPTNWTLVEI